MLVEGAEISAEWLKGVKSGWKKVHKDIQNYEGRIPLSDSPKQADVRQAMDAAVKALTLLQNYVELLSRDLLITKGAWDLPSTLGAKEVSRTKRWKTKIIEELHTAKMIVLKYLGLAISKQQNLKKAEFGKTQLAELLQRTHAYVDKATAQIDEVLMRLFAYLVKTQAYYAKSGRKLGGKGFEPKVNHVGPFTVVFKDTPEVSPKKVGSESYKKSSGGGRKRELKVHGSYGMVGWRHPKNRTAYLKFFKLALARLKVKGLEWLADIKVSVKPKGAMGPGVLAYYYRQGDLMGVAADPTTGLVRSIIHELGHRYYYKHMTAEDRHNFDKWFGDVAAVTPYGATKSEEDFPEVFSYYVMNRKLTKDQRDRFRQFMTGKKPRTESMEESTATKAQKCKYCDEPAKLSLIWADGRAYIPVCRAHERQARNDIASQKDSVVDVKRVEQGPVTYREHQFIPSARMEQAMRDALDFVEDEEPGTYFGLQADPTRAESALQEAPAEPPPRARIGRRGTPRGAVIRTVTGKNIQGVKGRPIKRATGRDLGKGTSGPERIITKRDRTRQEIPDSLLQMLGTDWKTMRANRVHDNRMSVTIDGVKYTVYTRRG